MITYKEAIEEFRKRYGKNEVSALIGAGFSKNIYRAFPSWDELLHDMIMELYRPEIKNRFRQEMKGILPRKMEYAEHCRRSIREIIDQEGYLNIVSKYIGKKGLREAIETYIEERIPHVNEEDSSLSLLKAGRKIKLKDEDFEAHTKLLEGAWDNIYTTNYDHLLEFAAKRSGKCWNTIRKARDLSFNRQAKNIIKLHGDLCRTPEDDFEFDGNCHHRYVISQEDYKNYPSEHEAFTQLMRISLLQGTFCLFGFSGNDPNFTSWLHWVRDILVMQRKEKDCCEPVKQIKIFLIDIGAKRPPTDKQLFYNNHHIFHIPLSNKEVQTIIGAKDGDSPKERIIRFLTYLYDTRETMNDGSEDRRTYSDLWRTVYSKRPVAGKPYRQQQITIEETTLQKITLQKPSNRIVENIQLQTNFLHDIYMQEKLTEVQTDLLLSAWEDTYYLPEYFPEIMKTLKKGPSLTPRQQERLGQLKERGITLHRPQQTTADTKDEAMYEQCLRCAFTLDFSKLRSTLSLWKPQYTFRMKKAMLLALFDAEEAQNELVEYIDQTCEIKERYYATELLRLIDRKHSSRYSTVKYENQNIKGLENLRLAFFNKVTQTEETVKPYGQPDKKYIWGNHPHPYECSLRVLQFLIEAPLPIAHNNIYTTKSADWYKVFSNIFEYFPYPCLFYSLQITRKEVLQRIGQEYAYADSLQNELPDMLKRLLDGCLCEDTPKWMKNNMLIVAKELFVSVNPSCWKEAFMDIWTHCLLPDYGNINLQSAIFIFACEGLKYLNGKKAITQVIKDCLTLSKLNRDATIELLYHLKNKTVKRESVQTSLEEFICHMDQAEDFPIAANIYPLWSVEQQMELANKIKDIANRETHIPEIAFSSMAYFTRQSGLNQDLVKHCILNSPHLWDNGILPANGASLPDFIRLSQIKRYIRWTTEEQDRLYDKMKESFHVLTQSQWYKKAEEHIFPIHYHELLKEMHSFLIDHQKGLSRKEDYSTLLTQITKELQQKQGFADICEALTSDDSNLVIRGTHQMFEDIKRTELSSHCVVFDLLIDRIVFKRKEGIHACLSLLAYYIQGNCLKQDIPISTLSRLSLIPALYTLITLRELDTELPTATKHLINIAEALQKAGYTSDGIRYWTNIKKSRRFNTL